ncbi:MAG: class I SAM-dependent methyltransferase [Thermoplasmata archaeon]|nr:class I SAM-dependent methyltransferase [Thermoplasmata archaeon]
MRVLVKAAGRALGRRVLDLGCGGGVLGFVLERRGRRYVGVDLNPDMIREARRTAEQLRSRCAFVLSDLTRVALPGRFDTLTLIGPMCHLTAFDVARFLRKVRRNVHRGTTLIVDYEDGIRRMAEGKRKTRGKEVQKVRGRFLSIARRGVDTEAGLFPYSVHFRGSGQPLHAAEAIWSPFVLEALMAAEDWELVRRVPPGRHLGFRDIYRFVGPRDS